MVRLALVAVFVAVPMQRARAQWGVWQADSLLASGRLAAAESTYYAAARARPRDPIMRAALGRYLAARGATKVGAVLIEEARFFGGDSAALAEILVPLYYRLGDFESLASLRPIVLSPSERRRAIWLADHPSNASLRDSVVMLSYRPIGNGDGLGTVILRLGRAEIPAVVDPRVSGLVLTPALRDQVRAFGREGDRTIAVADRVRLGGITFSNLPAVIGQAQEKARIGLDVLAPYAPTFDPARGVILLRRVDRRSPPVAGARVPILHDTNGVRLLLAGRWQPTWLAIPAMMLATRVWMWDGKSGEIVLLNPSQHDTRDWCDRDRHAYRCRCSSTIKQRSCTTSIPARARRSAASSFRMPLWNQTAFGALASMSSTCGGMSFGRRKTLTRSTSPGMSAILR